MGRGGFGGATGVAQFLSRDLSWHHSIQDLHQSGSVQADEVHMGLLHPMGRRGLQLQVQARDQGRLRYFLGDMIPLIECLFAGLGQQIVAELAARARVRVEEVDKAFGVLGQEIPGGSSTGDLNDVCVKGIQVRCS